MAVVPLGRAAVYPTQKGLDEPRKGRLGGLQAGYAGRAKPASKQTGLFDVSRVALSQSVVTKREGGSGRRRYVYESFQCGESRWKFASESKREAVGDV